MVKNIIKYKDAIIALIVGITLGGGVMFLLWPERVAKLADGKEVIASVADKNYTADELFSSLKDRSGLNVVLEDVDNIILRKEYPNYEEEAKEKALEQAENYYKLYEENYGMSKEELLASGEFKKEEDFINYLIKDEYYNKYYKDYLATLVTDKEIEKEYNANYFATRKDVYFFSSQDDKDLLEKVRSALKGGTKASKIEDKYKDVTVNHFDELGYDESLFYSVDIIKNLKGLKAGTYTKVIKDESFGYLVIYAADVSEKQSREEVKDTIVEILSNKKDQENENLYYQAMFDLRDKYELKFQDTSLAKLYEVFKSQHK